MNLVIRFSLIMTHKALMWNKTRGKIIRALHALNIKLKNIKELTQLKKIWMISKQSTVQKYLNHILKDDLKEDFF